MTDLDLDAIEARANAAMLSPTGQQYDAAVVLSTDVPALVAEVRRLREDNARMVRDLAEYRSPMDGGTNVRDHRRRCGMTTTDPAVTAAAEALCTPIRLHTWVVQERPCELCVLDAQDMLRAARPVVENEVRTSIRRRYETNTCGCGHDRACHNSRDLGDCTDCPHGTCVATQHTTLLWDRRHGLRDEAEVRERIAADIANTLGAAIINEVKKIEASRGA